VPPFKRPSVRVILFGLAGLILLGLAAVYVGWFYALWRASHGLSPDEAAEKARVGGKYQTLLAQIHVPDDVRGYSQFNDYGYSATPSYGGQANLPAGYWVYAYPYWHIWRDQPGAPPPPPQPVIDPINGLVVAPRPPAPDETKERIARLEEEVRQLRARVEKLEKAANEKK
jgi:hypothetical protein